MSPLDRAPSNSIELPLPPRELHPNARPHHMAKARAKKAYREQVFWTAKSANLSVPIGDGDIAIRITVYPKTKHIPDRDNLVAWLKSGLDGLADAMGVNDQRFDARAYIGDPVKGGKVCIEVLG